MRQISSGQPPEQADAIFTGFGGGGYTPQDMATATATAMGMATAAATVTTTVITTTVKQQSAKSEIKC